MQPSEEALARMRALRKKERKYAGSEMPWQSPTPVEKALTTVGESLQRSDSTDKRATKVVRRTKEVQK